MIREAPTMTVRQHLGELLATPAEFVPRLLGSSGVGLGARGTD
jgi:hypothetical protein